MSKHPDSRALPVLPRRNAPDHLPWRFAALVVFGVAVGELLTNLWIQHSALSLW